MQTIQGVPVMIWPEDGPLIGGESDAMDYVGNAMYGGAAWAVIPAGRFAEDFFRLRTRIAGDIVQKFVNYRVGLVVLGDISAHVAESTALRDFVRECNRGRQTWFLTDFDELEAKLGTG